MNDVSFLAEEMQHAQDITESLTDEIYIYSLVLPTREAPLSHRAVSPSRKAAISAFRANAADKTSRRNRHFIFQEISPLRHFLQPCSFYQIKYPQHFVDGEVLYLPATQVRGDIDMQRVHVDTTSPQNASPPDPKTGRNKIDTRCFLICLD